jgi:hypothetical protein
MIHSSFRLREDFKEEIYVQAAVTAAGGTYAGHHSIIPNIKQTISQGIKLLTTS